MTALLSEISIYWVEAVCKIRSASCGSKHASQPHSDAAFCVYLYWMTFLLLEMFTLCGRAGCDIWSMSYGSIHPSQSLSDKQFVLLCTHNLKTMGHKWTFCISNDCSPIGDFPCLPLSLHERSPWRTPAPDMHQSFSDATFCAYTASLYIHRYLVHNYKHDNKTAMLIYRQADVLF